MHRKAVLSSLLLAASILAQPLPAQQAAQPAAAQPATPPQPMQALPAVPAQSVLRGNTANGGPAIPTTPPAESAHPQSILLWPYGAPGSEAFKDEREIVGFRQEADIVFPIIYNIHNPTLTPFLPAKDKATGCAVIIAPGGGHMFQTIDREGYDLAKWLADRGVAAFVLKYRLARDGQSTFLNRPQPYQIEVHAHADAQRAIRLIRSRAQEWGVNPERVGILGFSAGAEVALNAASADGKGNPDATDPLEKLNAKPNFEGVIYGLSRETRAADWTPAADFPPTFLLCASNDSAGVAGANGLPKLYSALRTARVPVELVIYDQGGHGFGVRPWDLSVGRWPELFLGWLGDRGFLKKS